MAFDIGSVIAKVDADISGFKRGMGEAKAEASGFGSHLKSIGNGIADFGKQAAVFSGIATAAIVAFGKTSVDAFNESQAAAIQMGTVLQSTGNAAGVTQKDLMAYAASLQKVTKYSDEAVMGGQNLLLTFTNIKGPTFKQATDIILDMSTALGQDLKSSAIQVGKALQDPILGVTALRRVGVNFNKDAQEMIKNLVETGHAAEAQQFILKELNTEFGGSAVAAAKTFGGQMDILKNKFDDVKESIGQVIVGFGTMVATDDAGIFAQGLENLGIKSAGVVDFFGKLAGALRDFGNWVAANKDLVLTFLTGLAIGLGALLIIGTITALIMALTNPLFLVVAAITLLYTAWSTNFMGLRDITTQVVTEIVNFWTTYLQPAIQAIADYFVSKWVYIKDMLQGVWLMIQGIVQLAWSIVYGIIKVGLALLSGNWSAAWEAIKQMVSGSWEGIKKIFMGAIDFLKGWGGWLFDELTKPFRQAWDTISALVNKIKDALDFTKRHSPSVVDVVKMGVGKVNDALGDLAISGSINANAAGLAVSRGGDQANTNIIQIDMAGAFIADSYGAGQMAELLGDNIIKRLQNNVRI